jgi:16S rRNA (guanine527-N7)-methyltransferase
MNPALDKYLELLLLWNRRINLTAVRDPDDIREKHFADSLALLPFIPKSARTLVDVGSGAGFPGAVLATARPDLAVTLVEANQKKSAFLQTLRRELALDNLTILAMRVEKLLARPDFQPFDVAVSRATWDLPKWLEWGSKLIRPDGLVIGMEGSERHPLPEGAERLSYPLGSTTRAAILYRPSK